MLGLYFCCPFNSSFACVGPETTSIPNSLSGLCLWVFALCAALLDSHRRATSDFIIICVLVSYIRWYVDLSTVDIRCLVACCIAAFVGVAISFYGQFHFDGLLGSTFANLYNGFFGSPASIFSLAIAISVLLIDLKMPHFSSRSVNAIAKLCFATYLISDYGPIQNWLWSSLFPFTRVGVELGILQVILVPTAVFAICLMLEGLRKLVVSFFIRLNGAFELLNKALS